MILFKSMLTCVHLFPAKPLQCWATILSNIIIINSFVRCYYFLPHHAGITLVLVQCSLSVSAACSLSKHCKSDLWLLWNTNGNFIPGCHILQIFFTLNYLDWTRTINALYTVVLQDQLMIIWYHRLKWILHHPHYGTN